MFKKVLFPIDLHTEIWDTLAKALELAQSHQSRLIILSIIQSDRVKIKDSHDYSSLLERVCDEISHAGIQYDLVEQIGKPVFVICDVADEMNADLIIMGTRGVNLEGDSQSTASRVIQLAPCPVLVVP